MRALLLLISMSQIPKHLCIDARTSETDTSSRREVWRQRLSHLAEKVKGSLKLRKVGAPMALLLQLVFTLEVAVAALPDAQAMARLSPSPP